MVIMLLWETRSLFWDVFEICRAGDENEQKKKEKKKKKFAIRELIRVYTSV